jgi:hypothetical protein
MNDERGDGGEKSRVLNGQLPKMTAGDNGYMMTRRLSGDHQIKCGC